jgi:hypothetical protein
VTSIDQSLRELDDSRVDAGHLVNEDNCGAGASTVNVVATPIVHERRQFETP